MSIQFDTFDTLEDRREIVILFQRLGAGSPTPDLARARWLESLIQEDTAWRPVIDPASCHPVGAYMLFIQIVGVLGVPIREAVASLERSIREA